MGTTSHRKRAKLLGLTTALAAALLLIVACTDDGSGQPSDSDQSIPKPALLMELPDSLTGGVASAAALAHSQTGGTAAEEALANTRAAGGDPGCAFLGSGGEDWFTNGYTMTKFLLALSQSQLCFADFVVELIAPTGASYIGKGRVATGLTAPGDIRYIQLEQDGFGYSLWLYFDETDTKILYMTWTVTGVGEVNGRFISVDNNASIKDGARGRFDFVRTAAMDSNLLYIGTADGDSSNVEGFRVDVFRQGTGGSLTYEAKGYVKFFGPLEEQSLPATETYNAPVLRMVTISDLLGAGAAIADFTNLAIQLGEEPFFNLGTYEFTQEDRSYFSANGSTEWVRKGLTVATYINNSGANLRTGGELTRIQDCLEDGTGSSCTNIPNLNLMPNPYFTAPGPCVDTAPGGGDCLALIQGLFDSGFGVSQQNSPTSEPTDFRRSYLDNDAIQLNSPWPAGEDKVSTFAIPDPP